MKENVMFANLSRREFLRVSCTGLVAGMVLTGCQFYQLPVRRTPIQVQFTSWGQGNVTFAELDLPFQDYAFYVPTNYQINRES